MNAMRGGATTAPTLDPVLTMPKARARSSGGNHSEIAFDEQGNPPPSPRPSRNRAMPEAEDGTDQAVQTSGNRPKQDQDRVAPAGSKPIYDFAPAGIHHRVGKKKQHLQHGVLPIRNRDMPLNLYTGDGKTLPVEIAKRGGASQKAGNPPAKIGEFGSLRCGGKRSHDFGYFDGAMGSHA